MINYPKISICIPAYNRPAELIELLASVERQKYKPYEVVICEDNSPDRELIRNFVQEFKTSSTLKILYFENDKNLGYDANLRNTISRASGDYVFLSGNDDLLYDDSLAIVASKITKYTPDIILRSYSSFYKNSTNPRTIHRYVKKDYLTKFSSDEAAWLFYRAVLVSGLVFNTKKAIELSSDRVDGTLYYQNYLLVKMFIDGSLLYVPDLLVHNRILDAGDFGSSEVEAGGDWEPGKRTIRSSIYQMRKFFECAKIVESESHIYFSGTLKRIASAYSFPLLAYHCDKNAFEFLGYIFSLRRLGYKGFYFYCYSLSLVFFGLRLTRFLINRLRGLFGYTIRLV